MSFLFSMTMGLLDFKYVLLIVILITFVSTSNYKNYTVENHDICSAIKKRKITIGDNGTQGVIVGQIRLSDHPIDWESHFQCKFQIRTGNFFSQFRSNHLDGLIAVIQHLNLRRDERTGECIDYIQFKFREVLSKVFCGSMTSITTTDLIEPLDGYIMAENGQLDTIIFVHRRKLEPNETSDFQIVYTSYKSCSDNQKYLPCLDDICIDRKFFNDSYINCPFSNCIDEGGCLSKKTKFSTGIGTKVAVGAIATLVLGFVSFLMCIWLCRKHDFLCWSSNCTSSNGVEGQSQNVEYIPTNTPYLPAAPPYESVTSSSQPQASSVTKDPPPSYDSLFPNR